MLPKTAVVKESVDQMELVNVTSDFTWRIVQVSLWYGIFFNTVIKIWEFEAEGRELIYKTNLLKQQKVKIIFETDYWHSLWFQMLVGL